MITRSGLYEEKSCVRGKVGFSLGGGGIYAE